MRFLNLQLRAFGPFTGVTLDFSANPSAIQIVYGPNEAGKSSALRAVNALLFGIPERTGDSFVHDNQALRIGAAIERSSGDQLTFLRRKGRNSTLLDSNENALPDDTLRPFLQGINENLFASAFGLNHEVLVKGGLDLAAGKGEIGEILFGAGLGLANLHEVLTKLESDAEDIFKQRGQVQSLNKALSDYKNAVKASRENTLPSEEFLKCEDALAQARRSAEAIKAALDEKSSARNRLIRIQKSVPLIAQLRIDTEERQSLGEVPALSPGFIERRITAQQERDSTTRACETLEQELQELETLLAQLVIPDNILNQAPAITELYEHLSAYVKAESDCRDLETESTQHQRDMQAVMQRLPQSLRLASGEPPRLDVAIKQRLHGLGNRIGTLEQAKKSAARAYGQATRQLETLSSQLAGLPEPRDTADLQRIVRRVQRLGDIEAQADQLRTSIEKNQRRIATALKQLAPAWTGTLDAFESLSVPLRETLERYETDFTDRRTTLKDTQRDAAQIRASIEKLKDELNSLQQSGPVPSESELEHARGKRSTLWGLVRRSWLGREDVSDESNTQTGGRPLETAYEEAVQGADTVADTLWHDADRASRRRDLDHRASQAAEDLRTADQKVVEAEQHVADLEDEWRTLWVPVSLEPLPPREMLAWLVKRSEVLQQIELVRNDNAESSRIHTQVAEERAALRQAITDAGQNMAAETKGLQDLIDTAQDLIRANDDIASERKNLTKRIGEARQAQQDSENDTRNAEAELAKWQKEWAEAVKPLNMPPTVTPEEVASVLSELDDHALIAQEYASKQQRILDIQKDSRAFQNQVAEIVGKVATELAELPAERAVRTLFEQLEVAKEVKRQHQEKSKQRERKRQDLAAAKTKRQTAEDGLSRLCTEARCQNAEELPAVENAAQRVAKLSDSIASLQHQLGEQAGGSSIDAFVEQVSQEDPDSLPARICELDQDIEELEAKQGSAREQIGALSNELSRMNGLSRAFEEAEKAESHLAEVNEIARRYAQLRIASAVLRKTMDRYRQTAQGPVLGRASDVFARITAGSFQELRTGFDERDQQVIQGLRTGSMPLGVDAMSEGTRDQLYLALRIGTLEHYLTQNEAMPLILDDILVNFDDERAAATLQVLAEVAQRTQVLFFTHHRHLIEIARDTLPPKAFAEHQIAR